MKFCDDCGTYMKKTLHGLKCPRCGHFIETESFEVKREEKAAPEPIYVLSSDKTESQTVSQSCPNCDSNEAYRTILTTQGEHAGVKQDRTIERYKCVKCHHTWVKK